MLFQRLLEYVGVAPERVQVRWISGSEGQKFAAAVGELAARLQNMEPDTRLRDEP